MKIYRNLVGGELRESGLVFDVCNPLDESVAGQHYTCSVEQAEEALQAAESAAASFRHATLVERCQILDQIGQAIRNNAEEIGTLLAKETGKSLPEAIDEAAGCAGCFDYYAAEVKRHHGTVIEDYNDAGWHMISHVPVGVVVSFTAFNFALWMFAGRLAAALATGNASIIKTSNRSPLAIARIGELIAELDLPKGLVSILVDNRKQSVSIMETLAASPIPRLLTIIGSTRAGRELIRMGATSIKRYELELGGNAPAVVYDDADPRVAARAIAEVKKWNAGQACVSPQRAFVPRALLDVFLDELTQCYGSQPARTSLEDGDGYNPVIEQSALDGHLAIVKDAEEKGARVVCGGKRAGSKGFFMQPTVLTDVTSDMLICSEEAFGPLLAVIPYDDEAEMLRQANDTEYGLCAYLVTNQLAAVRRAASALQFGTIAVNNNGLWCENLPHGGLKQSGYGKNNSYLSLEAYVDAKRISMT